MKGANVEMVNSRDERCNVLWESFRDRGRNIFTQQEILLLWKIVQETRLGKVYIDLFATPCFEESESRNLGNCVPRMRYMLDPF